MSATRLIALAALALVGAPRAAPAQPAADSTHTGALCWTAQPKPRCSVLLLTNTGLYTGPRYVGDLGLMVNVNPRDAVGASFFLTGDGNRFTVGPSLRYRRWTSEGGALDLALGVRGAIRSVDHGAVIGLIKYNFGPYFGLAIRPEIPMNCGDHCEPGLSVGFEIGSWPGALAPVVGGLIGLVALVANPPKIP